MPDAAVRAFLALPTDPAWAASASEFVASLGCELPRASWTRPSAWHLTIKFLGEAPREALEAFAREIAPGASATVPGDLAPGGATVFPPRGPAKVLGIGFAPSAALDGLATLAAAAEAASRRLSLAREDREFHPHITLARVKDRWPRDPVARYRERAAAWRFPAWRARSCVLYASRLDAAGAVHTPLAEWAFEGAAAGVPA